MKKTTPPHIAIACLSLDLIPNGLPALKAPTEIQLTPAGRFRAVDGRPFEIAEGWFIDEMQAKLVMLAARRTQNEFVIDYEHQTLLKESNGQSAPAAGWFKEMEWRESGLWAVNVKWTHKAEQMIINGEYRYLSPVFEYDTTGKVLKMRMAAITNSPGLDGMQPLAALTQQQLSSTLNQTQPLQESTMKKLLALFGLAETATEDDAIAALTALQAQASANESKVAALTAQVATPDPTKFVPIAIMTDLQTQLAALTQQSNQASVATLVADAVKLTKLRPSQVEWATNLGKTNLAALTEYLGTAVPVAALTQKQVADGNPPPTKTAVLTENQKAVAKAFGKTDEEFKKTLEEQGV